MERGAGGKGEAGYAWLWPAMVMPYPGLHWQWPAEGSAMVACVAVHAWCARPIGPGLADRRHAAAAVARLVRSEEGRRKESSGGDGAPAHVSHGERDTEERKRETSE